MRTDAILSSAAGIAVSGVVMSIALSSGRSVYLTWSASIACGLTIPVLLIAAGIFYAARYFLARRRETVEVENAPPVVSRPSRMRVVKLILATAAVALITVSTCSLVLSTVVAGVSMSALASVINFVRMRFDDVARIGTTSGNMYVAFAWLFLFSGEVLGFLSLVYCVLSFASDVPA